MPIAAINPTDPQVTAAHNGLVNPGSYGFHPKGGGYDSGGVGGFEIAETETFAYAYPCLEGLAHGAAGPRHTTLILASNRELSN